MLLFVCALFLGVLLTPDAAFAWGPITHLAHGSEILGELTTLAVGLQQLLRRHRYEYLYGCVGADIVVGKKFTRAMHAHCHSWSVGWEILRAAKSDAQRAFAYGYLSHLAADVFSHNHFIPTQLVLSFDARPLVHVYWEARFDSMQKVKYRRLVSTVRRRSFPECDRLAKKIVARTLFSFRTNKRIFASLLAFHDWNNWHQVMKNVGKRSGHDISPDIVARYNAACQASILDLLRKGKRAACQQSDPIGLESLALAKSTRRTLKALQRRGGISPEIRAHLDELSRRNDLNGMQPASRSGRARR